MDSKTSTKFNIGDVVYYKIGDLFTVQSGIGILEEIIPKPINRYPYRVKVLWSFPDKDHTNSTGTLGLSKRELSVLTCKKMLYDL